MFDEKEQTPKKLTGYAYIKDALKKIMSDDKDEIRGMAREQSPVLPIKQIVETSKRDPKAPKLSMWERAGLPKAARKKNLWDRGPAAAEARVADSNAAEIAKLEDGIEKWVIRN